MVLIIRESMLLKFDFGSSVPIYMQLRNQVVIAIAEGTLVPGEQLPTIRALAEESGINMMTVSKAYQLLKQEGYIVTDRRSGTVVMPRTGEQIPNKETLNKLRLCVSELRIAGVSCEELMDLCRQMYEEGNR